MQMCMHTHRQNTYMSVCTCTCTQTTQYSCVRSSQHVCTLTEACARGADAMHMQKRACADTCTHMPTYCSHAWQHHSLGLHLTADGLSGCLYSPKV